MACQHDRRGWCATRPPVYERWRCMPSANYHDIYPAYFFCNSGFCQSFPVTILRHVAARIGIHTVILVIGCGPVMR